MAAKHNRWMEILNVIFSALASLFASFKIPSESSTDVSAESDDSDAEFADDAE